MQMPSFEKIVAQIDKLRASKRHPFNQVIILYNEEIQHIYTVEDGHEGVLEIRLGDKYERMNFSLTWSPSVDREESNT